MKRLLHRLWWPLAPYPWVDMDNSGIERRLWRGRFDRFDAFALVFMGLVLVVLIANAYHLRPWMSDTWYHLAIAKQIVVQGRIPEWCTWDYAPVGRPLLYPPLLHLITAGLSLVTGNVAVAGQVLAVTFWPISMLTCWYAARWIFNSRVAVLAVLLLSLDFGHAIVQTAYIAGCLVNMLAPLLVVAFVARRVWLSVILLALMLYAHLGFGPAVALGLVLFGLKYSRYRLQALGVVAAAVLLFSPWLYRIIKHQDWLAGVTEHGGLPFGMLQKIISLQILNAVLLGCGIWGWRRLRPWRAQEAMLKYLILGYLPILFTYGGRFNMHTAPLWAILGGSALVRLLPEGVGLRRVALLATLTLLPMPGLPPLTGPHMLILLSMPGHGVLGGGDDQRSERYLKDCDQLAAWLQQHTLPNEVIFTNKEWIGDMIPLLADRATDRGAWWETSKPNESVRNRYFRDTRNGGAFVYIRPKSDTPSIFGPCERLPGMDHGMSLGRFDIGIREPRAFQRLGPEVGLSAGDGGWRGPGLTADGSVLTWVIPPGQDDPQITWSHGAGRAGGVEFEARASRTVDDLMVELAESDGSRYVWPLDLPQDAQRLAEDQWKQVRIVFAWLTPVPDAKDGDGRFSPDELASVTIKRRPPQSEDTAPAKPLTLQIRKWQWLAVHRTPGRVGRAFLPGGAARGGDAR